ncbi:hypothetical protein niasHT_026090 [Heterodera trifolii]|uniref:SKP1 component dimerisation domain-containing protein n=1 Tax=Heterodera trifolii TaxID=157864 RepID=A0ABD2KRL6_9BILA
MSNNENENVMNGEAVGGVEIKVEANEEVNTESQEDGEEAKIPQFSKEQMERSVMCCTNEGEIVNAPWHLMAQSKTFMQMWESLGMEEKTQDDFADFVFPLNDITSDCFQQILAWMREHHNLPEPIVKEDPVTQERIWFKFTDWERQFFDVDFERVKEYFLASNFLDIRSLYLYCAQECARCIMDKSAEEIREMLCLEDDLTEEEKAAITREYDIPRDFPTIPLPDQPELSDVPGTSGTSSNSSNNEGKKMNGYAKSAGGSHQS